jgi:hypothetical protein
MDGQQGRFRVCRPVSSTSSLPLPLPPPLLLLINLSSKYSPSFHFPKSCTNFLAAMGSKPYDVENGEAGPTSFCENVKYSPSKPISHSELDYSAKWMYKDPDLWVFRRFGRLHLFNVLCLQRRLTELEERVRRCMWENEEEGYQTLSDDQKVVQTLLPDIQRTLKDYGMSAVPSYEPSARYKQGGMVIG